MRPRFLFVVKFRENYDGSCGYDGTPSCNGGLYNSALFVVQMLRASGVDAKLAQVCDNNDIDREVSQYRPTHVIIEALWVVPGKFKELIPLHSHVKWIIRCHSEIPFIAYEGVAIDWIIQYLAYPNVYVASNSSYGVRDFRAIAANANWIWWPKHVEDKVPYLPNYYPVFVPATKKLKSPFLNIGCFGAIRPLKNQLIQALAAVEFAHQEKKLLRLHVNARTEQGGQNVLENIRALVLSAGQELVEHTWETREQFLKSVSQTDIGMQVSFSETFDITAADTVSLGVPLVTSNEVTWSSSLCQAAPTNTASIVAKLHAVTGFLGGFIKSQNLSRLRDYCEESRDTWLDYAKL